MLVRANNQIVELFSYMPFNVSDEKRVETALAVCIVNYKMLEGSFDFDISDGKIIFRLTSSYRDSILGEDLFEYMITVSAQAVDCYNDKFFMLAKGMITIQQFIEQDIS